MRKLLTLAMISLLFLSTFSILAPQVKGEISPGSSEKGILQKQWSYGLAPRYWWGYFGSSSAIADLGPDVNIKGTEPDSDLEIVVGCDGYHFISEIGWVYGLWRCLDSQGNLEWATDTLSDEARSSPVIVDLNGDGYLEIAAGTTSGETFEVMDRFGNFIWTFPSPPRPGNFYYPGSPAVADLNPDVDGLEIVIGNRPFGTVLCFDGDNSDGINEGISATGLPGSPYAGSEGVDWDLLWIFYAGGEVWASPAIGDVDNDGALEVVVGSTNGKLYILNGRDGIQETSIATGGAIYASAALANLDTDPYLEIVVGVADGKVYCFEWKGTVQNPQWIFPTTGAIYSSAAIGDVDGDGHLEIVVGSNDGKVYCLSFTGKERWTCSTGGPVYSSPALFDCIRVGEYELEWSIFRHDAQRTGFYGHRPESQLDVGLYICIGSNDGYLYLLSGKSGAVIDRFRTNGEIRTSPSVADVDGDRRLEVVVYDWSTIDTLWVIEINRLLGSEAAQLAIDVIGAPYLGDGVTWGGKGWDGISRRFVSESEIRNGYYYYDSRTKTWEWGQGLDCSGLVFWAYNRAYYGGRDLPVLPWLPAVKSEYADRPLAWEGASGQFRYNVEHLDLEATTEADLRPGDLIFFKGHVAIYTGDFLYGGKTYNAVHASYAHGKIVPAILDLTKRQLVTDFEGKRTVLKILHLGRVQEARNRPGY